MTTLPTRLRDYSQGSNPDKDSDLVDEAADRIEELEAQVAELTASSDLKFKQIVEQGLRNTSLVEKVVELSVDARRLDWLDGNLKMRMGWNVGVAPAGNISVGSVIGSRVSIRDAIDAQRTGTTAAIAKEQTE